MANRKKLTNESCNFCSTMESVVNESIKSEQQRDYLPVEEVASILQKLLYKTA